MLKVHNGVGTLWQLTGRCMVPAVSMHKKLGRLCHSLGVVRWRSSFGPAPLLTATPTRALIDEQIAIEARFLAPHQPVTVLAQLHSEDGDLWEAFSHYNTNRDGSINLAVDPSVGGTYLGCEPMGLFWGLTPALGENAGLRLRKKNVETPYVTHLSLLEGHLLPSDRPPSSGQSRGQLAAITVDRWYTAPGIRRIDIRHNGVVGTLFLPTGPGPFPAMIDLWGMAGGLNEYRSSLFASRGFASLTLAYFGHKDLPGPRNTINVGKNYFRSAYRILEEHPQVCGERIGVIGLSFGVFLSLLIATRLGVDPKCVIGINGPIGSNTKMSDDDVFHSLTFNDNVARFDDQSYVSFREVSAPANIPPENRIKMENLNCPLLYIEGQDDPSSETVENGIFMEEGLMAAGKGHLFSRLSYPGAGHLIEPPYAPNARITLWSTKPKKLFSQWGGELALHAAAQEDSWKKTLAFMEQHLRG